MSNDSCRRAWEAMQDLCGGPRENRDSNTFYVQVVMSQGREVSPQDTDEVASVLEKAAQSIAIRLGMEDERDVVVTAIETGGRNQNIEGFIKLPVDRMPIRDMSQMDQIIIDEIEAEQVDVGRGLDMIDLVDRSVVAEKVPEMVGPAMEQPKRYD